METLSAHYGRLLGIDESWRVEAVDLRLEERRVEIMLRHVGSGVSCPECGCACGLADHAEERRWRHLDTMQFTTELVARLPRSRCPEHGLKTIVPPWAGKHSRFTLLFEAFAIEVLQACRTVQAAADLLGLSWDAAQTIMERAVERGLERREATAVPYLGIDEKSFGRGHDYITVLTDINGSRVLDLAPERTVAAAEAVLQTLTVEQRQEVQAVAADMLPAYAEAVARQTPRADLVHDKFHIAKHLGEAVDQVRRAENKALQAQDDDRLKGTRQLWLFRESNLSPHQRRRFEDIKHSGLKTARAWAIKEEFRWFWRYVYQTSAEDFFRQWYAWGVRCRLRPVVHFYRNVFTAVPKGKVKEVAAMLKAIHAQEDRAAALEKARAVQAKLEAMRLTRAAQVVAEGVHETLTYMSFPREHWSRIRTNNMLERVMREIRRRTRVVGNFPDGKSALMLVGARLRHVAGTRWGTRPYMDMTRLAEQEAEAALSPTLA